jgi:hypothetical protein
MIRCAYAFGSLKHLMLSTQSTFPRTFHILKSRNYRGEILSEKKARHSTDEKSLQSTSEMVTIVSFALFIVFATLVAQVVGNIG